MSLLKLWRLKRSWTIFVVEVKEKKPAEFSARLIEPKKTTKLELEWIL